MMCHFPLLSLLTTSDFFYFSKLTFVIYFDGFVIS